MFRHRWFRRAVPLALALGLTAPTVAHAQGVEAPRIPLRTAIAELTTFRSTYEDAYNSKNVDAVMALYADDAIIVGEAGNVVVGKENIRAGMSSSSGEWGHMIITSDTVRVYGATAIDVGTVTSHPPGGGEMKNRYTVVLRNRMNAWQLVSVAVTPIREGM